MPAHRPLRQRFEEKYIPEPNTGCWLWLAGQSRGYGMIKIGDRNHTAHRVAYELYVGKVPEGFHVDHLCRNPPCVNPEHLEAVPQRVNVLRGIGITARYARRTHCGKGHEFTPENTYLSYDHDGTRRRCRECVIARIAESKRLHPERHAAWARKAWTNYEAKRRARRGDLKNTR